MSELVQYHCMRFGTLKTERSNFDTQWEEAAERILPAHRNSFTAPPSNLMQGQKQTELQFDSTAGFAAYRFSSVMESLATPQGSLWHMLKPVDKMLLRNRAVRAYFDDVNQILFNYRYRPVGNFVGNSQQVYLGLGVYGNGILYVDQPDNGRGLRYRNIHLGEAYFVENHAGIVDTVYRKFSRTARQLIQEFGEDKVPEYIRERAKNAQQSETKSDVLHCVYPRADRDPTRMDAKGKKFASLYILTDTQDLLREGGYDSWPFPVARYTQAPGEVYGRGPGQMVLPAIKVLNEEKSTMLKQGHRAVDPVYLMYDDGLAGTFSAKPGAMNAGGMTADGKRLIDTLPVGNIAVGDKMMEMERATINDAFLVTLFQILVDTPQMTATEVLERAREKGMLLAPTAGRLQAEFLGPMVEREIDLLGRQGLLPPMPGVLRDLEIEYRVEYDSPMSRMQRSEKAAGFMRALDVAANYAKLTMDPTPLDFFAFDRAMPDILDINGAPVMWTATEDEVAAKRAARAEQAQAQQAIEAAPAIASVVKSGLPGQQ